MKIVPNTTDAHALVIYGGDDVVTKEFPIVAWAVAVTDDGEHHGLGSPVLPIMVTKDDRTIIVTRGAWISGDHETWFDDEKSAVEAMVADIKKSRERDKRADVAAKQIGKLLKGDRWANEKEIRRHCGSAISDEDLHWTLWSRFERSNAKGSEDVADETGETAMMVLTTEAAVRWARGVGADDRAVARLERWKERGLTDDEKRLYGEYQRRFQMGRGFIELALSHSVNPGTLRQRYHRRRTDINECLRFVPKVRAMNSRDLVRVRRREGRWVSVVV